MIVDSHAHVSPHWYEPVETLIDQMNEYGVDMAILTQMIGQTDNRYQQDCVKRYPGRLSSVAWVDVEAPDVAMTIENLAAGGVSGIRLRPSSCLPDGRLPEAWRAVQETGLPVSCVGSAEAFNAPGFIELVARLAGTTIVLEHLGGTSMPVTTDEQLAIRRQVFKLAAFPNVMLKVPGLGELMPRDPKTWHLGRPFGDAASPLVHEAVAAFGANRLMWGSDFPVVSSREGYGNALDLTRIALNGLPDEDLNAIFGGNALRVFGKL
ncbi:L-fuconolactonase [Paraburkholderia sp. HC6.4b]|uniref:amidohydrolase family protein n=1 Tax=unclassified Paraburkholderia TaxID=2615204 RepID=UPI00160C6DB9|nr:MULTISPECIES: amidohydrolase family protein [unclassified Paraburkholderia]MBB5411078.1 L-fuconolactonase [Paraburkholderia sp. HC6.4b]MBB5453849.1 L-fuconolactonase [Paraburkholderia sp. Kb1A]